MTLRFKHFDGVTATQMVSQGTLTKPKTPLRSLLKTVRDTNRVISGRILKRVRLNSLTASGEAPTRMSLEKRSGRRIAARIPIMAETEWPT
ncbi:hypothetical protein F8388_003364 [Cannabis sativa]|uniref:Uncharacterized protein n=1 Tax=Cannabis sativa TaxID=3483 RepID=A0A7J6FDB4_CANSA|nr:hypothetical protein F8388_003364 [Cannabis sativa]